ncbi:MAG: DUF2934 domain-containing protein [Methylococcaceae bacterium]
MDSFNAVHKPNKKEFFEKDRFHKLVAERAYCKAEKRGFTVGHELEDWLEAEAEIKNQYFYWFHDVE